MKDHKKRMLTGDSLIGAEIRNPAGERLGDITELMIDLETGEIAYAVLAVGGFLGLGEKLFALPWEAFDEYCMLDLDKAWFKAASGFDKDHWPEGPDLWFAQDRGAPRTTVRRVTRVTVGT